MIVDIIGYLASLLVTMLYVPQAWKSWHTKRVEDISVAMFAISVVACVLWLVYGAAIHNLPILLTNSGALIVTLFNLLLIIRYKK